MTPSDFTWSERFPLDKKTVDAKAPKEKGVYSIYVVGPEEIVCMAGYVSGTEDLVWIGASWRKDGGLRTRLGGRATSIKDVLPVEDDPGSNLCLEEKMLIRLGLKLEIAFTSGAKSRQEATAWEGSKLDEYKSAHDDRLPPGNTINSPGSR